MSKMVTVSVGPQLLIPAEDGSCITDDMLALNGKIIVVQNESEYKGECGVDWAKYDFVLPIQSEEGEDVFSWKKEWLEF